MKTVQYLRVAALSLTFFLFCVVFAVVNGNGGARSFLGQMWWDTDQGDEPVDQPIDEPVDQPTEEPTDQQGGEYCGNGYCNLMLENRLSCPDDCGAEAGCGDGQCTWYTGENMFTCPDDCAAQCGDGWLTDGEECESRTDCPVPEQYACNNCRCELLPSTCGDGQLNAGEECERQPCPPTGPCTLVEIWTGCSFGETCSNCQCTGAVDAICGDGIVQTANGEQCDGDNLAYCSADQHCTGNCRCAEGAIPAGCGICASIGCNSCKNTGGTGCYVHTVSGGFTCVSVPDSIDCQCENVGGICGNAILEQGEACEPRVMGSCPEGQTCASDCSRCEESANLGGCNAGYPKFDQCDAAWGCPQMPYPQVCVMDPGYQNGYCRCIPESYASCGNGLIDNGEQCDPATLNSSCPLRFECQSDCTCKDQCDLYPGFCTWQSSSSSAWSAVSVSSQSLSSQASSRSSGKSSSSSARSCTPSCFDTDGSQDIGTAGTINLMDEQCFNNSYADRCASTQIITEYYCSGDAMGIHSALCPSGRCGNGACVPGLSSSSRTSISSATSIGSSSSRSSFSATRCGDGQITSPEICDDRNSANGDGCSALCAIERGWMCVGIPSICQTLCGDTIKAGSEQCDDGNLTSGDGCSRTCRFEGGSSSVAILLSSSSRSASRVSARPLCGNKRFEAGEECEPGVVSCPSGKQCNSSACLCVPQQSGATDTSSRRSVSSILRLCGNGIPDAGEQCEVNIACPNGGACAVGCQCIAPLILVASSSAASFASSVVSRAASVPASSSLASVILSSAFSSSNPSLPASSSSSLAPSSVVALCGNGLIEVAELCDDGNVLSQDGCSDVCQPERGYVCFNQPSQCLPVCGDALRIPPEQCDDGNTVDGDGCSSVCETEFFAAPFSSSLPSLPVCGNGMLEDGEQCDDGNVLDGDGCSALCIPELTVISSESSVSSESVVSSIISMPPPDEETTKQLFPWRIPLVLLFILLLAVTAYLWRKMRRLEEERRG